MLNETHDPQLQSWVLSANHEACDFPIQNLPHGVFRSKGAKDDFRGGVAIGDEILDLRAACEAGVFSDGVTETARLAASRSLNDFMAQDAPARSALRLALSCLLRADAASSQQLRACMVRQSQAEFAVPAAIGDFTDFLSSQHHSLNAGRVFNPDNALLPNFKWLPIGYHGRSSTISVSGGEFHRPCGQVMSPGAQQPGFGPSRRLDYELEMGIYVGPGNDTGRPIPVDRAEDHLFGMCLLNDWSARDLQAWEMFPLGPFLSKNFATTISPWIVTWEALAPFRCEPLREAADPATLPYLQATGPGVRGAVDIQLEAWLSTAQGMPSHRLSRTSLRHAYWTPAQMLAHHASNGCGMRPGDLLGTGTQSGPHKGEEGCLLELSMGGKVPVVLPNGQRRSFVEDGDTVTLRAWCEAPGRARIGFGECRCTVLPALE